MIVNRLWQHHFGEGLVRTPDDFGTTGDRPAHPELLDWLACELIRGGWRLKPIRRIIMSSDAYRLGVAFDPARAATDPENRLHLASSAEPPGGGGPARRDARGAGRLESGDVRTTFPPTNPGRGDRDPEQGRLPDQRRRRARDPGGAPSTRFIKRSVPNPSPRSSTRRTRRRPAAVATQRSCRPRISRC